VSSSRVTVVIPAYRSERWIEGCLEGLAGQTHADFEVVVVNSSSERPTRDIVTGAMPGATFVQSPVRLLPHDARAAGIACTGGELIAFLDPDCRPEPDWLELLVRRADEGMHAVAGAVVPAEGASRFETAAFACKQRVLLPGPSRLIRWAPTASLLVRRSAYIAVGGFPAQLFAGDVVLGERLTRAGMPTLFEPRARAAHRYEESPRRFLSERLSRGVDYGRVRPSLEGWSAPRRAIQVCATPLAALRLVLRTTAAAGQARLDLGARGVAWVVAGQACWALGEAAGYLRPSAPDRRREPQEVAEASRSAASRFRDPSV
jgi:mycofactocin glycosyltransferase